jgi:hypothetical protein
MIQDPLELARLVANVRDAEQAVNACHVDEWADESGIEQAVRAERQARDNLASWMSDNFEDEPLAIVMYDGSLIVYGDTSDNLILVNPANIHKLSGYTQNGHARPRTTQRPTK